MQCVNQSLARLPRPRVRRTSRYARPVDTSARNLHLYRLRFLPESPVLLRAAASPTAQQMLTKFWALTLAVNGTFLCNLELVNRRTGDASRVDVAALASVVSHMRNARSQVKAHERMLHEGPLR